MLFFNTSKIQFESKSQQKLNSGANLICCFSIRQRYNLKANHNPLGWEALTCPRCFSIRQRYNLKANHNSKRVKVPVKMLFFNTSKIQFESKSQQPPCFGEIRLCCFSIRQRYNLKANHNFGEVKKEK